jgi:Peptidase family M1 domain
MTFSLLFLAIASLGARCAPAGQAPPGPGEMLAALNRVQLDPQAAYKIEPARPIELRRGDAKFLLEEGWFAFFAPVEGNVTGAVFSGRGHVLAAPRDPVEKQQIAHFLGTAVVDLDFTTAYLRFTGETAAELRREFASAGLAPQPNAPFTEPWQSVLAMRNPGHSLRFLYEAFSATAHPYFAAALGGAQPGPFDFFYDEGRDEPEMFGQFKHVEGVDYYDIWTSHRMPGTEPPSPAFHALQYRIETAIRADNQIAATAVIRLRPSRPGERLIGFQFSHLLAIESATLGGEALFTYPNDKTVSEESKARGTDALYVVLPRAPAGGEELEISFRYHGNVIHDAGNGVLFVDARETWYPHLGDTADFSDYDLTFHWPRKLRLAATGSKLDEREEGEQRTGHWRTERPAAVAGFNLGEYAFASLAGSGHSVDVYANRQLEQALLNRLRLSDAEVAAPLPRSFATPVPAARLNVPFPEPSPADALKQLARDIDSSIRFYEGYSGPFPVRQLSVSQIPGTFGQGWPGLLYLSTYSYLPAAAQERAGLSASGQEHFHDLVPFHEVAHQWWGNVVGWSSYRDQWIDESLATYLSLLFADSQKSPEHRLRIWLERYRKRILEKAGQDVAPAEIGGLVLGTRLNSSRTPEGFESLVYGKGAWVMHMLREMLREPKAKNPDARFMALLGTLRSKYAYRALSTGDLQREVEAVMTPAMAIEGRRSMEWFFSDWVRGTGVPHYKLDYTVKPSDQGFVIKGKLLQTGVAASFVAPVPVYSRTGAYLGRVIAGGPETSFRFVAARDPGKLLVDPQMTLLCVADR